MRIAVIGPLYPYRGGMVHSNTVLCENLARRNSVLPVSFSRMFPEFLYPGRSQKDPGGRKPPGLTIRSVLDTLNPLSWIRTYRLLKKEQVDLVAFQWWTPYFTPCYTAIAWLLKRFTTARISVMCHHVNYHESRVVDRLLTRLFFRNADFFLTYSASSRRTLEKFLPHARVANIVEGTYDRQIGRPLPKASAKKALLMKGKNLMFFGFVRDYKGLEYLLDAMKHILKNHDVTLHVVGEFWEGKERHLEHIRRLGIEGNVRIIDSYIPNSEVVKYFSAVDAVVLPYTTFTGSGIIQLAFGLNVPVIASGVGVSLDVIEHGRSGLLTRPRDPEDIAEKICSFYDRKLEPRIREGMKKRRKVFEWDEEKDRKFRGLF